MKLRAWLASVLILMPAPSFAQGMIDPSPQSVSALDAGTACSVANSCASWNISGAPSVTMQVTGTFSGTLTFEATADGQTWFGVTVTRLSSAATATTTTSTGQFSMTNTGIQGFRARMTAYTSGGANVSLTRGTASAKSGGTTYTGTANQVIVTGSVLSTPQDIGTASAPQFARVGLGAAADASTIATIQAADNVQSLVFPTVTYTSNMTSRPSISVIATENTSAGTHDYLKMVITRTAGEYNYVNFLGGVAGATSMFSIDRAGNITGNSGGSLTGIGGITVVGDGSSAYKTAASFAANQKVLNTTGTGASSNTGTNAVSSFDLAHTLNTSGVPSVFKLAVTDTAHGAGTQLVDVLGGSAGTTRLFAVDTAGAIIQAGIANVAFVASNFTTAANTNLQTITGLSWTLPANIALNVPFTCKLEWSQATAAVVVSFGVQTDTVTPTNFLALGQMETNLTVTSYGDVSVANTTATVVVSGTPAATATTYNAYIDGFLENPSNASTTALNIMVKTATAGDVVTVYRGSFCRAN